MEGESKVKRHKDHLTELFALEYLRGLRAKHQGEGDVMLRARIGTQQEWG